MAKNEPRAITPAQAIATFERAFRSGNPNEVEQLLRDMLNVQVAVVGSKEEAQEALKQGKKLQTVSVPYGVFLRRCSGKKVYRLNWEAMKRRDFARALHEISGRDDILPNHTYILLKHEAGYFKDEGLTFEGGGETTGFEDQPEAEQREKFTEGRFQTWEEHARGAWERAKKIVEIYRPFVSAWAERVLSSQWEEGQKEEFIKCVLCVFQIAASLHDLGKLNEAWQGAVWDNEQKILGCSVDWKETNTFIARTSAITSPELREQLRNPPPHAPFAYPFLKVFLRNLLGDYRLWDAVALAAARHHTLEVAGIVRKGEFKLIEGVDEVVRKLLGEIFGNLAEEERQNLDEALSKALDAVCQGSEADEPPSPSDDFYFLYCLANRLVKICDWEDAGGQVIELSDLRRENDATA